MNRMQYLSKLSLILIFLSLNSFVRAESEMLNIEHPLSEHLAEFNGSQIGDEIILDWFTEKDVKAKIFIIEKAVGESKHFDEIGVIMTRNHNEEIMYLFEDPNPSLINKYRIKIVMEDGSKSYSDTLIVQKSDSDIGKK